MDKLLISESPRRWDCLSLGEVMLRLDPGESRIHTTRHFQVWEGGGEYNVARGLRRCFGLRTAIATALAENPVGRLVEDLILQGGVDSSFIKWVPYDGVGRQVRNGLNFTERGFGVRAAVGCSDRGHTAISQVKTGDFDWPSIFGDKNGAKWLHTGGIFAALSASTAEVAAEAMDAARSHFAEHLFVTGDGQFIEVFTDAFDFDAEHSGKIFFVAQQQIDLANQLAVHFLGTSFAADGFPEGIAEVEVVGDGSAVRTGRVHGFNGDLGGGGGECGEDAAGVQPFRAILVAEDRRPIEVACLDLADSGVAAV